MITNFKDREYQEETLDARFLDNRLMEKSIPTAKASTNLLTTFFF